MVFWLLFVFTMKKNQWCSCNILTYAQNHWVLFFLWHYDYLIFSCFMIRINTIHNFVLISNNLFLNCIYYCFWLIKNELKLTPIDVKDSPNGSWCPLVILLFKHLFWTTNILLTNLSFHLFTPVYVNQAWITTYFQKYVLSDDDVSKLIYFYKYLLNM